MRDKEIFWIDTNRKFMYQKDWQRPITDASFFLDDKLRWMDKNNIDHEVILNLSQLYCNGYSPEITRDVTRFQNDYNGSVQAEYPDKITGGFVIQPRYIDDALLEIERCVTQLNMHLLCLPTHFLDPSDQWRSVACPEVEPIFELANYYGLAMEIHPYDAPKMIGLKNEFWRFHLVWMCAQTADTYHMFTLYNYHNKYPKIRTAFAHGNQFGQINIGRRIQGYKGRPDLFQKATHPNDAMGAQNLYFDTLVHDPLSLELLIKRQGISQIIAGLDDPYPLGEMESVEGCYPGKVIDDALALSIISKDQKNNIWHKNVLNWLGKDNI